MSDAENLDRSSLADVLADDAVVKKLKDVSQTAYNAASDFWRIPFEAGHLSPRMCELVLLALHATPTALNVEGLERHVTRARGAGASDEDIIDVLFTITGVANHALYFAVPVLEEELRALGVENSNDSPPNADCEAAKRDFIATRGFWTDGRESFARLMPDYFLALNTMSTESWKNGTLSAKERDLICVAIDCTVTHMYEPGLRTHIRNAIAAGATRDEVLQIFQFASMMGLEGYVLGARALFA